MNVYIILYIMEFVKSLIKLANDRQIRILRLNW